MVKTIKRDKNQMFLNQGEQVKFQQTIQSLKCEKLAFPLNLMNTLW